MARRRSSPSRKAALQAKKAAESAESAKVPEKSLSPEREPEEYGRRYSGQDVSGSASPESGVLEDDLAKDEDLSLGDKDLAKKTSDTVLLNSTLDDAGKKGLDTSGGIMARAYGKYGENTKDTPKHLYGFDNPFMSSDEEGEIIDVQGPGTASSTTNLGTRIKDIIREHWKHALQTISFFIISGVLAAFLIQVFVTHSISKTAQSDTHSDALRKIEEKVDRLSSALQAIANVTDHSTHDKKQSVSEAAVQQIVQAALERYNADKVGMADFALESSGAEIHGSYHSPAYDVGSARVVLFGIPLWFDIKPPRVILQPDNTPGNCWAFKGTKGFVVIKLSKTLQPTAFSMEHIPKSLSPTGDGRIPSAPKEFTVWGWKHPLGDERIKLGYYVYNNEGDFLQTFDVQLDEGTEPVQYVELRILSNHGNPEYTCIYRFRVHGTPR